MAPLFDTLLPDTISPAIASLLIATSFVTSTMTAALGLGGGLALLAIMAAVMPVSALIPIHGVVQLGSNTGRALVQRRHIDWTILLWFTVGSLFGAAIGGHFVISLPDAPLKIGLAAFILWAVWGKKPSFQRLPRSLLAFGGLFATVLTMFFGATGPVVAGIIRSATSDRMTLVATHAGCMTLQHSLKVIVFGLLGFAFGPWALLLAGMLVTGFLGTLFGSRILSRMQEGTFTKAFKLMMTLLAVNLLWQVSEPLLFG